MHLVSTPCTPLWRFSAVFWDTPHQRRNAGYRFGCTGKGHWLYRRVASCSGSKKFYRLNSLFTPGFRCSISQSFLYRTHHRHRKRYIPETFHPVWRNHQSIHQPHRFGCQRPSSDSIGAGWVAALPCWAWMTWENHFLSALIPNCPGSNKR